jgi:hypothetical protein
MIPAWENLDDFINTDDFAVVGTIQPHSGGPSYPVKGHFDDPYLDGFLGDAIDRDDVRPKFVCKFSDVSNVVRFDTITIGSTTYDILTAPQGEGVGLGVLMLAKQ